MVEPLDILHRLKSRGCLPSMPQVLVQLLDICRQDEINLRELGKVVNKDSALCAKVLQLVNSAYIGARTTFVDIEQAVIYLGVNTIQNLTISAAVHQVFRKIRGNGLLSINTFWYHSYSNATLASELARAVGYANHSEAYLAGLLHDIGKLILWMAYPGKYAIVLRTAQMRRWTGSELAALERDEIGLDHCEAGFRLADLWQLPSFIGDAIRFHHRSEEELNQALELVRLIHLADRLSHGQDKQALQQAAKRLFNLHADALHGVLVSSTIQVAAVAKELGIPPQKPPDHGESGPGEEEAGQHSTEELKNRVKDMVFITGTLGSLLRAETPGQLISTIGQSLQILFHEPVSLVLIHDEQGGQLRSLAPEDAPAGTSVIHLFLSRHSECLPVRALLSKSIAILSKSEDQELICNQQLLHLLGTKDMACVPMLYRNQVMGVLLIGLNTPTADLFRQEKQLQLLACQAAAAIFIFRLHERETKRMTAEQLQAASLVARKIAHEINNPLAILRNYLKILSLKLAGTEAIEDELAIMDQEFQRIGQITNQLSDLTSHTAPTQLQTVDINRTIAETVQLFQLSLPPDSPITVDFQPIDYPDPVPLDRQKLRQILLNLLTNARDAIENEGKITVTLRALEEGAITIEVRDSGPGIPESIRDTLFVPGTSTKGQGHTGLGLSIAGKLVSDLGGRIEAAREADTTIFRVTLPT